MTELMVDKQVVITQANSAIKEYNQQVSDLKQEQSSLQTDINNIRSQLTDSLDNIATTLVSDLDNQTLDKVSTIFGINLITWYSMKVQLNDINVKLYKDIELTQDYINYVLQVHVDTGTLSVQYREVQQLINDLNAQITVYTSHPNFKEFFNCRKVGFKVNNSIFGIFDSKSKRLKVLLQDLQATDLQSLLTSYDALLVDKQTFTSELSSTLAEISRLHSIVKNHDELKTSTVNFEHGILSDVQNHLKAHIERTECLIEIRENCDKPLRISITTIIALKAKIDVLGKAFTVINREILNLNKNKNSIQDAVIKWTKSKNKMLSDKSKQLLQGPAKYKARTRSIVNSSSSVRYDTIHYVDYDRYDTSLSLDPSFPFWSIIAINNATDQQEPMSNILLDEILPDFDSSQSVDNLTDSEQDSDLLSMEDFDFAQDNSEVLEQEPEVSYSYDSSDNDNSSDYSSNDDSFDSGD